MNQARGQRETLGTKESPAADREPAQVHPNVRLPGDTIPPLKKNQNHERRQRKRNYDKVEQGRSVREDIGKRCVDAKPVVKVNVRYVNLPVSSCGYHGAKRDEDREHSGQYTNDGCSKMPWDGV